MTIVTLFVDNRCESHPPPQKKTKQNKTKQTTPPQKPKTLKIVDRK